MNRRYITLPTVLLALSLAAGCANYENLKAYEGPELPDDQIAILKCGACGPWTEDHSRNGI